VSFDLMNEAFARMPVQEQLRRERETAQDIENIPEPLDMRQSADHPQSRQSREPAAR